MACFSSLDAPAAAMLLVQEAEAIASEPVQSLALSVYRKLMVVIKEYHPLRLVYPILFDLLDSTFPEWVYPQINLRMCGLILWQGYRDACWPEAELQTSRELCVALEVKKDENAGAIGLAGTFQRDERERGSLLRVNRLRVWIRRIPCKADSQ